MNLQIFQIQSRLSRWYTNCRQWIWDDVTIPFLATRTVLLIVGWLSQFIKIDPRYPYIAAPISQFRLIDIWARWDSSWYLDIIWNGYHISGNLQNTQSNFAFYPLYPYLVKLLTYLIPTPLKTTSAILLIGVVLSNLFLWGSLVLLYPLIKFLYLDSEISKRAILYLLIFPTSFYFSAFYTESIFLFFSVAAFYAVSRQKWVFAGIMGFFAALSRPVGVLIFIPLALLYLDSIHFQIKKIRPEAGWLLFVPVGLLTYLIALLPVTNDLLAPFRVQLAWDKVITTPWQTIANPVWYDDYIGVFQKTTAIGCIILLFVAFLRIQHKAYSLYAFLLILPPLLSGSLLSFTRYAMVAFPFFIVLAFIGKYRFADMMIKVTFLMLLGLLMAGWCQYYPIF